MAAHLFRWLTRKGIVVGSSSTAEFVPQYSPEFSEHGSGAGASGLRQLKKLDGNLAHRRHMRQCTTACLAKLALTCPIAARDRPGLVRYPLRVKNKEAAVAAATRAGVELAPGSNVRCTRSKRHAPLRLSGGLCPVAEQACLEVVNLRCIRGPTRRPPADGEVPASTRAQCAGDGKARTSLDLQHQ